jgi:hypothetical protein
MASPNFEHPRIEWDSPDLYQEFTRFESHVGFVFAGPLTGLNGAQKSGWLGTWVGEQGREIYKTFQWAAEDDKKDPEKVLKHFETYVRPRKNKRIARHRFKQRKQTSSESFDNFVKDLRLVLMDCEYHDPDDVLIDAIIEGIHEKKLQERMLDRGETLTLAKALEMGQQFELSQKQMRIIHDEDARISALSQKTNKPRYAAAKPQPKSKQMHDRSSRRFTPKTTYTETQAGVCEQCGKDSAHSWSKGRCPAQGSACSYCKKPGHWKVMCRKRLRSMNALSSDDVDQMDSEPDYVSEVEILNVHTATYVDGAGDDQWTETLKVLSDRKIKFRIDTGARCNTIVLKDYQGLNHKDELKQSNKILRGYTNHFHKPIAMVDLPVEYRGNSVTATFQIVDLDQENVISGKVAEALGLIMRIAPIVNSSADESVPPGLENFPEVTRTTGTMPGIYSIKIDPNAKGVVHATRRQPAALKQKTISKLKEMEADGHITKVDEPTEWVNSMVVVLRNDKVRICIDPADLNKAIKREHYPMRTVGEVASQIPDAKVFSVLDAKSGFLQIEIDEPSSYLTTFNTPIGRYRWLRLPFGIKCAPEIYQRIMDEMLEGIEGAFVIMDDILIAGRDLEHHDQILKKVIQRATSRNLKLNFQKCVIRKAAVPYVGHLFTELGLKPDPSKIVAVQNMPAPEDKAGVKRFLGFITYLSEFIPNMSEIDAPLRNLLKLDVQFQWQPAHEQAFNALKKLCCSPPVLKYYDVNKPVEIHCDASQNGLGAVLIQEDKPIAYSSRALTDTEKRYAQIEKEMLSIVHACKKFHCYILGKTTKVYNDHKPLEVIFTKALLAAPMRLQRMLLSLQWYDLNVKYKKGQDMKLPDTLSRAYLPQSEPEIIGLESVHSVDYLSVSKEKYIEIQELTSKELGTLHKVILNGWPDTRQEAPIAVRPYYDSRAEMSVSDGIIFKGMRIVIPPTLREQMIRLIHESHLGIVKCKQRARETLYWPGMNSDIEEAVKNCTKCAQFQNKLPHEPLIPTPPPDLPFVEVGSDLFTIGSKDYLLLVDYYSKFIEVDELKSLSSHAIIEKLKYQFSRHGIPETLRSDCGGQYDSGVFRQFCRTYGIKQILVSPRYPRANGEAEKAVQTVKKMWSKTTDKQLALLDYRTTPLEGVNLSPAQLLMGRRPRNTLPVKRTLLVPKPYNSEQV